MRGAPGFQGLDIATDGEAVVVSSSWASIPDWEAFSLSAAARRSHLPSGIWQSVPGKGEGFPEDFGEFFCLLCVGGGITVFGGLSRPHLAAAAAR